MRCTRHETPTHTQKAERRVTKKNRPLAIDETSLENFTQRQRSATQPGTGPNLTAAERGRGKKEDSWNVLKEEGWGFDPPRPEGGSSGLPQWGEQGGGKFHSKATQRNPTRYRTQSHRSREGEGQEGGLMERAQRRGVGIWRRTGSGPSRDVSPEMGIWDKDPIRTDAGRGTPIMCRGAMSGIKHSIRPHGPFRAWSIGFRWGDRAFIEGGARPVLPHRCSSAMRVVKGSDRTTRTDGRTGNPDRIHATTRGMAQREGEDQKKKEDKNRGATGM